MALTPRGGLDIDQIGTGFLSAGTDAEQLLTTITEPRPEGNILVFDALGNAVNSGIPLSSLVVLLDILVDVIGLPILTSDGEAIYLT